ncbi:MAG TPA: NRDE family protein [Casimicrobiaceae bacterium]|nr:NRDE family protein [Casimicrobiaceae bacterium]
MCLAVVALDAHPRFAFVVAANRDEYHARPTAAATWWPEGLVAGRDLAAGGTWLGATRNGRVALLTNVRNPARHDPSAPSRGSLVPQVLLDARPLADAVESVRIDGRNHNGFNLIAGDTREMFWISNRSERARALAAGVYGVSNALLDEPWPKVERVKAALRAWMSEDCDDLERLFDALADRSIASDETLPSTGVSLEWERMLSAPFIVEERYGTRSSSVVTIGRSGNVRFVERSFDAKGAIVGETEQRFSVDR